MGGMIGPAKQNGPKGHVLVPDIHLCSCNYQRSQPEAKKAILIFSKRFPSHLHFRGWHFRPPSGLVTDPQSQFLMLRPNGSLALEGERVTGIG